MVSIATVLKKTVIPRGIAQFTEYMTHAYNKLITNYASYGIPEEKIAPVTAAYNAYIAAEAVASNPDTATSANRHARNTARKALETLWRAFLNEHIRFNPLVSEEDMEVFGIFKGDDTRTQAGVPDAEGLVSIKRVGAFRFEVVVLDSATGKAKNPLYATGSYLYVAVTGLGSEPEHADDFHKRDFSSNHRHVLEFPREQIGKEAHIYARYSNAHGKEGPVGPTERVVIS
ncbi:MAG: hypothetical protein LBF90_02145 [Prevotellaceae bacterium]|jgi:hypothetical protein|nr:hypothetical protein [Prevotellaceae bacterium]